MACFGKSLHKQLLYLVVSVQIVMIALADPIVYEITEEVGKDYPIGDIINDSGLREEFDETVLTTLRFTFLTQSEHRDLFWLSEQTGQLRTSKKLDRDAICQRQSTCDVELDIAVKPVEYFRAIKVLIRIQDINDNTPKFPQQMMASSISESTMPGILFPIPSASDPDSPKNSVQRYEFFSNSDKFELRVRNSTDGRLDLHLALKAQLDREDKENYVMRVVAYDGGVPPKTGTIGINITVVDINDNSPRFLNESYSVNVPENTPVNVSIIRVRAEDPDYGKNGEIIYGFETRTSRSHGQTFGINVESGDIFIKNPLDFETESEYTLGVTAKDKGVDSLPTSTKVIVNIIDVNDHAPLITINAFSNSEHAQIPEDAEVPYFVAYISIFDPDQGRNGQFNCTLDDPKFELVPLFETEFKVNAVESLDREESAVHNIELTCTDKGYPPQTSTQYLNVIVTDKNDNGPHFTQHTYFATLLENNDIDAFVLEVKANDRDVGSNADIVYSIEINAQKDFRINSETGIVRAIRPFDRELTMNFEFKVTAADRGTPPRTDQATILITILDEDDNLPKFSQPKFSFEVMENRPPGVSVGQVLAVDGDLEENSEFTFEILQGVADYKYFTIEPSSGIVSTLKELDREEKGAYSIQVIVKGPHSYGPTDEVQVVIYVGDENDNEPILTFPSGEASTIHVSPQAPHGYVVDTVIAEDADEGRNAELIYVFQEGTLENDEFTIGDSSGDIFVNKPLTRGKTYQLIILVKDLGFPQRVSVGKLYIIANASVPYIPLTGSQRDNEEGSDTQMIIIAIVIAITVVVAALLIVAIVLLKRRDNKDNESVDKSKNSQYFQRAEVNIKMTPTNHNHTANGKELCDTLPRTHAVPNTYQNNIGLSASHASTFNPTTTVPAGRTTTATSQVPPEIAHQHHPHNCTVIQPGEEDMYDVEIDIPRQHNYGGNGTLPNAHSKPPFTDVSNNACFSISEKDTDSGCCADMSGLDSLAMGAGDEGDSRSPYVQGHGPAGSASILKIKSFQPAAPRKMTSPSPPTVPVSSSSSSSNFSDWLNSEGEHLRQSGNVYKVSEANKEVPMRTPSPNMIPSSKGKSVRFNDTPESNVFPAPGSDYSDEQEDSGYDAPVDPIAAIAGSKYINPRGNVPAGSTYRNYDVIPEEPELIQDIIGTNLPPPPEQWADEGSMV